MSQHYAGLDVSLDQIHINVLDATGSVVWRGMSPMCPDAVAQRLAEHAPDLVRVGLETGQLSTWLTLRLRHRKLRVVCLDARHARAALKLQLNKTDAGDAHYLAQIVRTHAFACCRRTSGLGRSALGVESERVVHGS